MPTRKCPLTMMMQKKLKEAVTRQIIKKVGKFKVKNVPSRKTVPRLSY